MKKLFIIILLAFSVIACEFKQGTGQWNLNKTMGCESENPDDYTIVFIKWIQEVADSNGFVDKRKLDDAVAKELRKNGLGDPAENDISTETDMHFVVSKDYKNALNVILSVVDTFNVKQKVIIYQRDYKTFRDWVDTVIYPE